MKTLKLIVFATALICGAQVLFAQGPTQADKDQAAWDAYFQNAKNKQRAYKECTRVDPCYLTDDDEWFTASNNIKGDPGDPKLVNALLQYNQEQLYMKLSGRVQQMTSYYFDYMNLKNNKQAANHIEGLCQKKVNQFVMETREACRETLDDFNDKNKIIIFMSIRVRKMDIMKVLEDVVKNDTEAGLRYDEEKFREAYSNAFDMKLPE